MRTPLNGIIGLLQIAERHFDDKDLLLESHKKMQVAANYLLSLINDVLQMSKIEDGNVPLTKDIIDFSELTKDIIDIIEQRAKERGIKMQFNAKNDIRYPFVYGSPVHLRQIFLNIYGNCIKYNHIGGSILTTSDYTETDDGVVMYEWTITDTGIGMSKEYKEHIFEPFSQERQYIGSTHYGIGLGMSIVKGLIEKMGGSIEVESEEGVGSTFIIKIPFKIASTPYKVNKQTSEIKIDGLNLLLVEDNELNAEIAETLLSDEGAVVTVAKNGLQAVNIFKEKPEGSFDAILMDIMMPVMDGLEAARRIRELDRTDAQTVPIVAMTANAFFDDIEMSKKAGMNEHLSKPLKMESLVETIYKLRHSNTKEQ